MITFKDRKIGENEPVFIVGEVGINHNGSVDLAKKCIDAVKRSGADAIKFQNYFTDDFILDKSLEYSYRIDGVLFTESQYDMFKRCELNFEELRELKEYCDALDLCFFSTPTSRRGIEDLVNLKVDILKNGSDFLVNLALISEMAKSKIPTVLSTGMATLSEIDEAVRCFKEAGGEQLVLLHCVSSYPAPMDSVNLNKIQTIKQAFGCPVGFSDHTDGIVAAIGSVAKGACFIEKHFTLDKNLKGPDHHFSCDEKELTTMVQSVRAMELAIGSSSICPSETEMEGRRAFRLSCVANKDMKKGETIRSEDIAYSRPSNGLPPKLECLIQGKTLITNVKRGEIFRMENVIANG